MFPKPDVEYDHVNGEFSASVASKVRVVVWPVVDNVYDNSKVVVMTGDVLVLVNVAVFEWVYVPSLAVNVTVKDPAWVSPSDGVIVNTLSVCEIVAISPMPIVEYDHVTTAFSGSMAFRVNTMGVPTVDNVYVDCKVVVIVGGKLGRSGVLRYDM